MYSVTTLRSNQKKERCFKRQYFSLGDRRGGRRGRADTDQSDGRHVKWIFQKKCESVVTGGIMVTHSCSVGLNPLTDTCRRCLSRLYQWNSDKSIIAPDSDDYEFFMKKTTHKSKLSKQKDNLVYSCMLRSVFPQSLVFSLKKIYLSYVRV